MKDERWLDLAGAILDGSPIAWDALSEPDGDSDPAALEKYRLLAEIANAHRATPGSPDTWGALQLRALIGRGTFGDVYRAHDPALDREVAVKLLRRPTATNADEARRLARVRHPNVVTIHGAGHFDGVSGIWMELVRGETLAEVCSVEDALTTSQITSIGIDVCRALAAVHDAGLLHGDIKPQNVMREPDGRVVLMDFGTGRRISGQPNPPALSGTPLYLAPEVLSGQQPDVRTDIYAVGVLLYYLLTKSTPVEGRTLDEVRAGHAAGRYLPVRVGRPSVAQGLGTIVDRALSPDPANRFQSAADFEAALSRASAPWLTSAMSRRSAIAATLVIAAGLAVGWSKWAGIGRAAVTPRRIRLPQFEMGRPSGDGALFPYVDEDGHLYLWEVATGRSRRIVEAHPAGGSGLAAVMSVDGGEVAYGWRRSDGAHELRVVSSNGTGPRTLIPRTTAYTPVPVEWSGDGRSILCRFRQRNGTSDLVLVPADGGSPQLLHSAHPPESVHASLSRDGRFVVLSAGFDGGASQGLRIIDTANSQARVLVAAAANERLARWCPDGTCVLFLRDSPAVRGSGDAWTVTMDNGHVQGEPVLAASDLGAVTSIALTQGGALYRILSTVSAEVYTAPFDLSGATAPGPPTRILAGELGNHVGPAWSPDGRSLAYFTTRETTPGANPARTLTIQDMVSGEARQVPVPLLFVGGYSPRWSPDGRRVMIWGRSEEREESFGYFEVEVDSGALTPAVTIGRSVPAISQYSPNGQHFLYGHPLRGIVARHLSTGDERVAISNGRYSSIGPFVVAPDGESIAFIGWAQTGGRGATTLEVQSLSGRPHELARATAPDWLWLHAWTPDGEGLLFARGTGTKPYTLWRISARGGEPIDMRFSTVHTPNPISLSPDGQRIAYAERIIEHELWITPAPVPPPTRIRRPALRG